MTERTRELAQIWTELKDDSMKSAFVAALLQQIDDLEAKLDQKIQESRARIEAAQR